MCWRLRGAADVPRPKFRPMDTDRSELLRNLIFRNLREDFETMSLLYAGTVHGAGLDCRTGDVHSFEGSTDGIWNKVGYLY